VNYYKGNGRAKTYVLRRWRNTASVGDEMTSCGKLFYKRLPMKGKARSPTVIHSYLFK